jgi:hypothetical protein
MGNAIFLMGSATVLLIGNAIRLMGNRADFEMGIEEPIEIFLVSLTGADDRSCVPVFRGGNFRSEEAGREVRPVRSRESVVRIERRTGRSIGERPRAGDRPAPAGRSDFFTNPVRDPFKGSIFAPRSRGRSPIGLAFGPPRDGRGCAEPERADVGRVRNVADARLVAEAGRAVGLRMGRLGPLRGEGGMLELIR